MIVDAHNGGMEAKMEHFTLEEGQQTVVADMHNFDDEQDNGSASAHLRKKLDPDPG